MCLVAGTVLRCICFDPGRSVRVDVGFAIAGFGGVKPGLTLNHVSPVHGCPSNALLACVGSQLLKLFRSSISSLF